MRIVSGIILGLFAVGCATTGVQRAEKTVKSMQATEAELVAGRELVAETMGTLNQIYAGAEDLRPLYETYRKQLKQIEQQAELAGKRAEAFRRNRDAYVGAWAEELGQIGSPEIRALSKERRAETIGNFSAIERMATATREAYRSLLVDLNGIHRLLGQDLTSQGVTTSVGQYEKARMDAETLQTRITELIRELDRVSGELAPSTTGS